MEKLEESTKLRKITFVSKEFRVVWHGVLPATNTNIATHLPNIYKNAITPLFKSDVYEFKFEQLVTKWMIKGQRQHNSLEGESYLGVELNLVGLSIEGDDVSCKSKHIVSFDLAFSVGIHNCRNACIGNSGPHHVAFNTLVGNEVRAGSIQISKAEDLTAFVKYDAVQGGGDLNICVTLTLGIETAKPLMYDKSLDKLAADMNQLLVSGAQSDFVIKCGPDQFPVHKGILSSRSSVLAAMFNSGLTEAKTNKIQIVDFEPVVIKYMLEYMYTSKFNPGNMSDEELFGLAKAAHKYELTELHGLCLDVLMCNLNEKNAGHLAVLGYLQDADPQFKLTLFNFCATRWASLADDEEYQKCVKDYPEAFFKP